VFFLTYIFIITSLTFSKSWWNKWSLIPEVDKCKELDAPV